MKVLLFFPLLLASLVLGQDSQISTGESSLLVLASKWSPIRRVAKKQDVPNTAPPPEMNAGNKSAARAARVNNPLIPDPNEQTIDGRSAALEKISQEARTTSPKPLDGFSYETRVKNTSDKNIEIVFWEYQFIDPASNTITRHQFLCGVKIKPGKERDLEGFSVLGPSNVVNATSASGNSLQEKVRINRVEYSDGSMWQRRDWNFAEIREGYKRALETPWQSEMCRNL